MLRIHLPGFLKYMTTMPKIEPIADGMIACALMRTRCESKVCTCQKIECAQKTNVRKAQIRWAKGPDYIGKHGANLVCGPSARCFCHPRAARIGVLFRLLPDEAVQSTRWFIT